MRADANLNYEGEQSHQVTIRVTDSAGNAYNESFTVAVNNVNEAPTDISLSNAAINEGADAGTSVGTLVSSDPDSGDSHSYAIVGGTGAGKFIIDGNQIKVADGAELDFEAEAEYTLQIRSTDAGGLQTVKFFTISIANLNEGPADLAISAASVAENSLSGTVVGQLSASDPDAGETFTFSIVDDPAGLFSISGLNLVVNGPIDFEAGATPEVTIRVTDSGGLSHEEVITINVTNQNESPEDILLVHAAVNENTTGAAVGTVTVVDPDIADAFAFSVSDDRFEVVGGTLKLKDDVSLDFEEEPQIQLTVTATDAGSLEFSKSFTVAVANGDEGAALDGYISGALVFADANGDGQLTAGEASTYTDAQGNFTLFGGTGSLVMVGGIDISTNLEFTGIMRAPAGSTVVTPLTTLVVTIAEATGQTVAQANSQVLTGLGLDPGLDLASFDPIAAALSSDQATQSLGEAAVAAAVQVQNTIVQAASLLVGADAPDINSAAAAVVAQLAIQINAQAQNGESVDLGSSTVLEELIVQAAVHVGADTTAVADTVAGAAAVISSTNTIVSDAVSNGQTGTDLLSTLAQVSVVAQGVSAEALNGAAVGTTDIADVQTAFTGTNLTDAVNDAPIGDVAGVNGPDNIIGTNGNDVLEGFGGDDTLSGLAGQDILIGGDGNDILDGGAGVDRAVYGDATGSVTVNLAAGAVTGTGIGTDTLQSIELVSGGAYADNFNAVGFNGASVNAGSSGTLNEFEGRGGDDVITGNGNTRVSYLNASAGVTVNLATGTGQGTDAGDIAGVGTDTFTGVNAARGSNFNDTLLGSNSGSPEQFEGRGGDDFINGFGGSDRAVYQFAASGMTINLAAGTVTGDGSDTLRSVELIRGSELADVYDATGFTASSTNAGSAGVNGVGQAFNEFEGLGGNDIITGNGNTRIAFNNATGGVTVDLAAGMASGDASVGSDTIIGGVNNVVGSAFGDTLSGSNNPPNTGELFEGRAGNDTIDGRGGFDTAGYNNDAAVTSGITVDMAAGTVTGDAAVGIDTLQGVEAIRGTNFADTYVATGFSGSSANAGSAGTFNEFEGLGGNDIITGNGDTRITFINSSGPVTVDLAAGTATGNASVGSDTFTGVSRVRGSNATDTILGDGSNNILEGQGGNDTITGRGGNDTLTGGTGDDTFVFATGDGADVITDFTAGAGSLDKIDLSGLAGLDDFLDLVLTQDGANTVIDLGGGDSVTLTNVIVGNLHQDDFLL